MASTFADFQATRVPHPRDILALLKPVTWFPPIWAFVCGVISSGVSVTERWPFLIAGVLLTGPLVCGTSQAINDWFDRHVDAINEPNRPIPSGRIAGRWGLWIAMIGTALSSLVAAATGAVGFRGDTPGTCLCLGLQRASASAQGRWLGRSRCRRIDL